MASSGSSVGDKYRNLDEEEKKNTVWRFGQPPNYDIVNKLFEEGQTKVWPPGSLEEMVQNLTKTWEMELLHKARIEDFKLMEPNFIYSLNGRKGWSLEEVGKMGGGYNPHLQTSLPEHLRIYDPAVETSESSHRAFTTTFPRGFAIEIQKVYSGPPQIMSENNKLAKVEFFYDRGELLGQLVKGEKVEAKDGEIASTCPIMRSTG
ncbi:hypothetical protein G4B88_000883 [Cannabis sativa]|uniref:Pathogen-related protein n=1 Tax=Cannabis sativa TaxID=3483 RepID=A0A7J6EQG0_CANSA|nr:hypothetical protein G4B88_000883 [Cannabis sativa]